MAKPSMIQRTLAGVREYFTLAAAKAQVAALGPGVSAEVAGRVSLAQQRAAAADTLQFHGHRVEGMRLLREGVLAAESAARAFVTRHDPSSTDDPVRLALALRGAPPAKVDEVMSAFAEAHGLELPEVDDGQDRQLQFDRIRDAVSEVCEALDLFSGSTASLTRQSRTRVAGAVLAVALLAAAMSAASRRPPRLVASASAVLHPSFSADLAVDGREDTRFLLPDGVSGHLDVRIVPPMHVDHVRLLNAVNAPYFDRSTDAYTLQVYSRGRLAKTLDGRFAFTTSPTPVDHAVDVDAVDRLRIVIRSHHRIGGGIAEVEVE